MPTNIDWLREISNEELKKIPFKTVEKDILQHDVEQRGFVSVPIDYTRKDSPRVNIFYRLIPAKDLKVSDSSKPTLVVIHGGPGIPSSLYRPYNFDYTGKTKPKVDYLSELSQYFRILILDQRGTDGNSCPIDMDSPDIKPEIIARYFDSRHIALDHQEVINTVLPKQDFFIIAQSYGGMVGSHYMSLSEISRLPKGIIFSAAAMPHGDFMQQSLERRAKQKELNLELKRTRPDLTTELIKLKKHFAKIGAEPNKVNILWSFLGQGEDGDWQKKLDAKIKELMTYDLDAIEQWVKEETGMDFLNYILSNAMMSPGYTDSTLAKKVSKDIPYQEEWMLDECWVLERIGHDGSWKEKMIRSMDANPHPGWKYPPIDTIRNGFARSKVLFCLAEGDVYVPLETFRASIAPLMVPGVCKETIQPGGHKAAFLPKGARAVFDWSQDVQRL